MITGAHAIRYSPLADEVRLPDGGELGLYQPRHPTAIAG